MPDLPDLPDEGMTRTALPFIAPCRYCGADLVRGKSETCTYETATHPKNDCHLSAHSWWQVPRFFEWWNDRLVKADEGRSDT